MKVARPATVFTSVSMVILVATSFVWGRRVQLDERVKLGAAPLVGAWRWRPSLGTVLPVVVGAIGVVLLPRVVARARFWIAVASTSLLATAFTLALAASDGWAHVLDPVIHPTEYWANLATLPPASTMLHHYGTVDFLLNYSVHAKGHPPAFLLLLKAFASLGLGHPWVAGALSYIGVAVLPAAVMVTVRSVASATIARGSAPYLALAPYAVWMGTSADAFYTAVAATGVASLIVGLRSTSVLRRRLGALIGGLLLGFGLFLTYGFVPFLALPVVFAVASRVPRRALAESAVIAAIGAAVVTVAFRLTGFWWFDGLRTTKQFYWWGTAHFRPWRYFLVGNLGVSLLAIGPVIWIAIASLRTKAVWWIVGAGILCIAIADLSQYSKGEVERIWLLFFPWLIPAAGALRPRRARLAVHAGVAVVLQTWLVSKW